MKGKKKSNTANITFLGEVSDYLLTNYRTRRFFDCSYFLSIAFSISESAIPHRTLFCMI